MERDFGAEIVRMFGARLRRTYEQDEQGLPVQMAESLERLKRAEQDARGADPSSRPKPDDGGGPMPYMPQIAPAR